MVLQNLQNPKITKILKIATLRYLEVGKNLKSPVWPVWVLGSETHLTVLFSRNLQLVSPPSQRDLAREQFSSFDTDNAGFISSDKLQQLMQGLVPAASDDLTQILSLQAGSLR